MTDRDPAIVERELIRLIRFLPDPEPRLVGGANTPRASAPTVGRGVISA
jgi:hypothetical protein